MKVPRISRRAFLTSAGVCNAAVIGYAGFIEADWLDLSEHTVKTNFPGPQVKLLHISDLHASWSVSLSDIDDAISLGLQWKPDLICVTGDFVTSTFDDFDGYQRILSRLAPAAPTYAVLGNHDGGRWAIKHGGHGDTKWVRSLIDKSEIELLHNRSKEITVNGRNIRLVGVGDRYSWEDAPGTAFGHNKQPASHFTILMAHNPDTKDFARPYPWHLMLSGHTHGGQFYLPFLGTPFAPVVDKRFVAGLYEWQGRQIHITKGVGNVYGMRFNCRPEISLLTLT